MVKSTKNSLIIEIENVENPFEKWKELNSGMATILWRILNKKEIDIESKEFKSCQELGYWVATKADNRLLDDADIY